jgi:hypothetical protein
MTVEKHEGRQISRQASIQTGMHDGSKFIPTVLEPSQHVSSNLVLECTYTVCQKFCGDSSFILVPTNNAD